MRGLFIVYRDFYCSSICSDPANLSFISFGLVENPSSRLTNILSQHNLPKPVYILEPFYSIEGRGNIGVKKTLNNLAGVYICINLVNGNMYVGSASFKRMYMRFLGHLYLKAGGSKIVNKAVLKYGLLFLVFVVIETVSDPLGCDKKARLNLEQKYLDQLSPAYNIVKIAGSVLNLKWSLESRERHSLAILSDKERINKIRNLHLGKIVSLETRNLMRNAALNRKFSEKTREKMSMNNAKSVKITAYFKGIAFKNFTSIAEAAEYFFKDRNKRSKIRTALDKNKLLLNKYELKRDI